MLNFITATEKDDWSEYSTPDAQKTTSEQKVRPGPLGAYELQCVHLQNQNVPAPHQKLSHFHLKIKQPHKTTIDDFSIIKEISNGK